MRVTQSLVVDGKAASWDRDAEPTAETLLRDYWEFIGDQGWVVSRFDWFSSAESA